MRVLVVSEGKHELRPDNPPGALVILVKRLLDRDADIESRKVSDPAVRIHRQPGKGDGMFKRAVMWMRYAERQGFDAVGFVVDEDGDRDRLPQLDQAQDETSIHICRAIGLAIRSFDAWMLADETALAKVLNCRVSRQPDPERTRDPKGECDRLREGKLSLTDLYAELALNIHMDTLIERCPTGFASFAKRVRAWPVTD